MATRLYLANAAQAGGPYTGPGAPISLAVVTLGDKAGTEVTTQTTATSGEAPSVFVTEELGGAVTFSGSVNFTFRNATSAVRYTATISVRVIPPGSTTWGSGFAFSHTGSYSSTTNAQSVTLTPGAVTSATTGSRLALMMTASEGDGDSGFRTGCRYGGTGADLIVGGASGVGWAEFSQTLPFGVQPDLGGFFF